jgi:hypothetical protein
MVLFGKLLKRYVALSNRLTNSYETKFAYACDVHFPIFGSNPNNDGNYDGTTLFSAHQPVTYADLPDITKVKYYIPRLFKKESMLTAEDNFDNFYTDGEEGNRPFLETTYAKELPIQSKVVIYLEDTKANFVVDKKTAVEGADGKMLLRQYLIPLTGEY